MIELWPLEWLYRPLCGCCAVTNRPTSPLHIAQAALSAFTLMLACPICPSIALSPWIIREYWREGQKERKQTLTSWQLLSLRHLCVCKSIRCGRMRWSGCYQECNPVEQCTLKLLHHFSTLIFLSFSVSLSFLTAKSCNKFSKPYSLSIKSF